MASATMAVQPDGGPRAGGPEGLAMMIATSDMWFTRELLAAGIRPASGRRAGPRLVRIRRGAFTTEPPTDAEVDHVLRARAALDVRPDAALSHITVALLLGLPVAASRLDLVHVTAPTRRGRRFGVHAHGSRITKAELTHLYDVPVTCTVRTLLDCALMLPLAEGVAMIDNALHRGLADRRALSAGLPVLGRRHGLARAQEALRLADGTSESPGETRVRLILVRGGLSVEPQFNVHDEKGSPIARADFRIKGTGVLVEFDGRGKYSIEGDPERAHWAEKQRDIALGDAGFTVVRVTWPDLRQPDRVLARVRRAIAGDGRSSAGASGF